MHNPGRPTLHQPILKLLPAHRSRPRTQLPLLRPLPLPPLPHFLILPNRYRLPLELPRLPTHVSNHPSRLHPSLPAAPFRPQPAKDAILLPPYDPHPVAESRAVEAGERGQTRLVPVVGCFGGHRALPVQRGLILVSKGDVTGVGGLGLELR